VDLLICVGAASGLQSQYASHGCFVCHRFYLDADVERTAVATPGAAPLFGYRRQVTVDPVTPGFVEYHLRVIMIMIGTLDWLRFTYDFEIGPAVTSLSGPELWIG
jgi:hypothetical protein